MNDVLPTSIEALRESVSNLNQASDQLNDTVREIESILSSELSVGIPVSVQITPKRSRLGVKVYLQYRKIGQKYRIAVFTSLDTPSTGQKLDDVKPWLDCSRTQKIEAVSALPELIKEIVKEVNKHAQEVKKAALLTSEMLGTLSGKGA